MNALELDTTLSLAQVHDVVYHGARVELSQAATVRINISRAVVDDITADGNAVYSGWSGNFVPAG